MWLSGAVASAERPSRITWFPIIDDDNDGAGVELEYRADSSSGDSGDPDKPPVRMFFDLVDLVGNSKTSKSRISRGFFDVYRETLTDAVEEGYQSVPGQWRYIGTVRRKG